MTPLNDRPGLQIMTSPCAPPIFDDHLGSPSSPTNTAQLATSPYKSTFSSFFRSMASSDTLHDDQPISAVLLPPPLTAVASSADALIQLESCLDALKRPHQTNDVPVAGSMTSEMFSESSMSPGISSNGHAVTSGLSTGAELHTDSSQVSALMAATGEESAIGMELANACGWIFTGLVLEVVSLATESRRVAEGIGKNGQANAEEQVYNTTTHAQGHTNGEREQADLPCFRKDKGKQKEEHAATSTDGQQGSRRRRRFSLSFNIKEILNLDDIEERLNENPKNVPDDPCHWKADWDTLVSLLREDFH
ncbi:hypothetical protein QFC19_003957 [Naganishia cerealis]|uniref:Uncharacterized protein n=1 Tax=Naganishia cerealis TaxID=610337 RepID=A0ACC2VYA2_9TREE|nr:hypothetical protein QFC19_003957 [Naganishia cerealis]